MANLPPPPLPYDPYDRYDRLPMPLPDDDDDDLDELVTTDIRHSNAGVVHVGKAPPNIFPAGVTTTVYFHGFADLPHERGSLVESSNFHCLGHEWCLEIYSGGVRAEEDDEENVFLHLIHLGKGSVAIDYSFDVTGFTDMVASFVFTKYFDDSFDKGTRMVKFLKRKTALDCLVKGSLAIEVCMRLVKDTSTFIPRNPSSVSHFLQSLFMEEESADVVFEVGEERSNKVFAHQLVLRKFATQLAELCMTSSDQMPTVVDMSFESADAFKALLRYIYGLEIFNVGKDIARIKEILELAGKYEVVNLKLEVEVLLVSSISFDIENFVDYLIYAESNDCALLKETVMDFMVVNWKGIHVSNKLNDIPDEIKETLLNDMMTLVAVKFRADATFRYLNPLSIRELRQIAHEHDKDVDGSRQTLISLLTDFSSRIMRW